jgi:hypothetical protein
MSNPLAAASQRFGLEPGRALQTPRSELFTNAIGSECCDFT